MAAAPPAPPGHRNARPLILAGIAVAAAALAAGLWAGAPWQEEPVLAGPAAAPSSVAATASPAPSADGASPSADAASPPTSISLSDYNPASSEVRDGMVIHRRPDGVSVQVPGEPFARTYPAPVVPAGRDVAGTSMDIVGTGAAPRLAVLVEIRTPPSGANPEKYATVLRSYDGKTTVPLAETDVAGIRHEDFHELTVHGAGDGSLAVESANYAQPAVRFFNSALQEVGRGSGVYSAQHGSTVILADRSDDCLISAWSTATGAKLWERNFGTLEDRFCAATLDAGGLAVAVDGAADFIAVVDAGSGATRTVLAGGERIKFDPAGSLAVVEYSSADAPPALRVFETAAWTATMELAGVPDRMLNLQNLHLFDAKLYLETPTEQSVLDALTGVQLAAHWTVRPSQAVGRGWTLVADAGAGTYSLEANVDGAYPGPWW